MNTKLLNPLVEELSGKALEELHLIKLKTMLERVYEQSPYYKEKFIKAKVDPYNFNSLEQYQDYPFFDKYEERKSQALSLEQEGHPLGMHITCDIRDVNRMSSSSGTTGTPSFQGHTLNDRKVLNEHSARYCYRAGIRPGDKVLYAGVMSMWVAGIPIVDSLLEFGANVIPVGALVGSIKVLEMIKLTRPHVIMLTPSFALHLLKKSQSEPDISLKDLGVRKLVVYGEPGGSIPEVISKLSDGFGGAEIYDLAGGTGCMNPIFSSCEEHDGLHIIAPDHALIEILDRKTGNILPWEDGVEGEFVYTGLDRECGPLVRFMDGDKMRVNMKTCKCGNPGWRINILGRVDDMLLVKGVNVFPSAIHDIALKMEEVLTGNIQIQKFSEDPTVEPPLKLKVECIGSPNTEKRIQIKANFEEEIQRKLRFKTDVTLFMEGELNINYGATGKIKLIEKCY